MSAKNDGGAAFPHPAYDVIHGMSLRDWFAGQALSGMMSEYSTTEITIASAVTISYDTADAMLRAREKSQAPSASGASGGSCNPHDAVSPYAGPVVFNGNAKGPQ